MADTSQYKVGIVLTVDNRGASGQKPLKICTVNVGNDDEISVVTNATNVRVGSRCVIAPIGSSIIDDVSGEEITIKRTVIGGCPSEGMFCDSKMLGWGKGAEGIAAQVPDSYCPGDSPPIAKPGAPSGGGEKEHRAQAAPGLFERKLTKEEKKKLAEEKRIARKAAKEAKEKDGE